MATITTTVQPATVSPLKRLIRVHPLVAYFVLAFACMWLPVLPLTLSRNAGIGLLPYDLPDVLMNMLLALTTFSGPTLAAIIVIGVTEGAPKRETVPQALYPVAGRFDMVPGGPVHHAADLAARLHRRGGAATPGRSRIALVTVV